MSIPVVLVPGAPVLVPELSGTAAAETTSQVEVTLGLLRAAAGGLARVLVLGSDPTGRALGDVRSSLARWGDAVPVGRAGAPESGHPGVPDAALLGWWFLDRAGIDLPRSFIGVTGDGRPARHPGADTLVVVVADGPASLTPRAPVPEDPRGVALDSRLSDWLRHGGELPDPGGEVSDSVGWWSRPAWRELAGMVGDRAALEATSWAPFGVGYHCARWDLASPVSPRPGGGR
ncbi:hypothetical protein [Dietzia sp. PP-33]|uniref:hypothetical protein n=1 Tax=Dietzia sp. PP-33 TaxID=2957500 RepID=UPI0029B932B1|nr:hypothetical protein [Dietzia sp. PP-33]MDX2355569.1 hypothetical protein [Dietzia sp. PP-33]